MELLPMEERDNKIISAFSKVLKQALRTL
ncbi:hypothetical protein HALA3H3_160009 [Halomonas sp. A3H3]|nr:hypothetical protein HALA3H3_160009 [Halomonas sp. A3H3]